MRAPLSRLLSILLLLGPIGLVGCQSLAVKREPVVDKEIEQALQANEAARTTVPLKPAVPPEVSNALLPPLSGASGGKLWGKPKAKAEEMRYDFSVQKVPAQEFFSGLVAGTPCSAKSY